MKHNTFMEVFNKLAPWLSSPRMQSLFTGRQTKSDNDNQYWSARPPDCNLSEMLQKFMASDNPSDNHDDNK